MKLVAVILMLFISPAGAGIIDVFFAGGQSNATEYWAGGLNEVLQEQYPDAIVVHQNHPGKAIKQWYYGQPRGLYQADFYNTLDTAALQSVFNQISSQGDTYRFQGLFWFQGEGDTAESDDHLYYESRFLAILNQIETDFGLPPFSYTLAVIDGNRSLLDAARIERIDALRPVQFGLGVPPLGLAVDTAAYPRIDKWHLDEATAEMFGADMARAFLNNVAESTNANTVSEPSLVWLFGNGLLAFLFQLRRRTRKLRQSIKFKFYPA